MVDILQQSIDPKILWQMVSAIAAVCTFGAVLLLPAINRWLINNRTHKAIVNELYANKRCMQQISDLWKKRGDNTDGTSGYEYELRINATALRVSCESWENFKFELKPEAHKCLLPFFISCYDVIDPKDHLTRDNKKELTVIASAAVRAQSANEFLDELSATTPKCRYLRQY